MKNARILAPVDAEDECAVRTDRSAHASQERGRFGRMEVPNRRSREEREPARSARHRRQSQPTRVVCAERTYHDPWIVRRQLARHARQLLVRDVGRYVCGRLGERVEEQAYLDPRTRSVLDERAAWPREVGDLADVAIEDRELCAGQVVLVKGADALEELRSLGVVEQLRWKGLRRAEQAAQNIVPQFAVRAAIGAK